jgi:hypothetical protein
MNIRLLLICFLITTLTSCVTATYHLTVYEGNGDLKAQHTSKKVFVGTDAFVVDAVTSSFLMVYSLFVPVPSLSSSVGIYGGMDLPAYISQYTGLVRLPSLTLGNDNWVIIDDKDGKRYSYSGYQYKLERVKGE